MKIVLDTNCLVNVIMPARASEYTAFLAMKRGGRIVFSVNE